MRAIKQKPCTLHSAVPQLNVKQASINALNIIKTYGFYNVLQTVCLQNEMPFASGICSVSIIYDQSISYYSNVYPNTRVYVISVCPDIDMDLIRLQDFIVYEQNYGRNIIIKAPEEFTQKVKQAAENIDTYKNDKVRVNDPKYMVHSTTEELWYNIKESGALLAASELKKRAIQICEIGLNSLLEPADYSDHVMLDVLDGCGELVVNSRQLGYVCTDADIPYQPGVRLYFDAHKIISNGIAIRDGLHLLKVKRELSLQDYLISVVTKENIGNHIWTPTTYTDAANQYFLKMKVD